MKTRQDAWTDENDLLLAEAVLKHVREGSTQLNAFEEVGDILNRTSAACGFRWNAVVRHQYEQALKLARKHWKNKQRSAGGVQTKKKPLYEPTAFIGVSEEDNLTPITTSTPIVPSMKPTNTLSMADVISFLQSYSAQQESAKGLYTENEHLRKHNELLKMKNNELETKIAKLEEDSHFIQEDYETLMRIMNRARKQVLLDEDSHTSPSFKMDKNGNLERVAE